MPALDAPATIQAAAARGSSGRCSKVLKEDAAGETPWAMFNMGCRRRRCD